MSAKPSAVIAPVVKTVIVECTPEDAFRYFTADFDKWWPLATHSVVAYASDFKDKPVAAVMELRQGGRIYERTRSGEEHTWGTIVMWTPPSLVCFTWHPGRDEQVSTTVEIRFSRVARGTQVVLTHSGWERLGEDGEKARDGYNEGWEGVFVAAYAGYARDRK